MTTTASAPDLRTVTIDAGQIEYRLVVPEQTAEPATTITLLHEGLGCVALWRDFPEKLAQTFKLPVLAYSRFGYGGSDAATLPRPLSYMHDEAKLHLSPLLDALGITRTVLFGHSDGASIAAIYAGEVADPRVSAIVLESPHFFCEDISINSISNARTQWQTGMLRQQLARYHGDNVDCAFLGWNDAWLSPAFRQWNIEQSLARVSVPILGIQRSEDPYGSRRQLEVIRDHDAARREIHFFEGTGHAPHQEVPDQTLSVLSGFFRRFELASISHQTA